MASHCCLLRILSSFTVIRATLLTACRVAQVSMFTHCLIMAWSALYLVGNLVVEGLIGFEQNTLVTELLYPLSTDAFIYL